MSVKAGDIVTVPLKSNVPNTSNTFIVDLILGEDVLVRHPLAKDCFLKFKKDTLDVESPNIKDSTERSLDFARRHQDLLDRDSVEDLDSLCLSFIVKRKLTPRQKQILSKLNGYVAKQLLNSDVKKAMRVVVENQGVLDDFNSMWFNNFKGLFTGQQKISSGKQETSIYNMAGFVLAETENPVYMK